MADIPSSRDELESALAARRELGREYDAHLVAGFLDRIEHSIDERVDRRLNAQTARPPERVRRRSPVMLPLGSIALAIPITAVAGSNLHGADSVIAIVVSWIGIVSVNAANALGHRRGS